MTMDYEEYMKAGLFKKLKEHKPNRKKYRIEPTIRFRVDTEHYLFSFLPTVLWMPWIYRFPHCGGVIEIWWLHFHVLIGNWDRLSCRDCKHQKKCVESKRLEWYCDDVFEEGKKCSDFEPKYRIW